MIPLNDDIVKLIVFFFIFVILGSLYNLLKENKGSNFFLDEVLVRSSGLTGKSLAELSEMVDPDKCLWIACQSDKTPNENDQNLKGEEIISTKLQFKIHSKSKLQLGRWVKQYPHGIFRKLVNKNGATQ